MNESGAAMYEKFTSSARRVMQQANIQASLQAGRSHILVDDLLLALLTSSDCTAKRVFDLLQIDINTVLADLNRALEPVDPILGKVLIDLSRISHASFVAELAISEARWRHDSHVGTEHLLIAILLSDQCRIGDVSVVEMLQRHDLTLERVRRAVDHLKGDASSHPFSPEKTTCVSHVFVPEHSFGCLYTAWGEYVSSVFEAVAR